MKQFIILLSLLFNFLFASSQKTGTWKTDSSYNDYNSKTFLSKLDSTKLLRSDLQIRLWFSNGWSRVNVTSLLLLQNKNKAWNATYFTFSKSFRAVDSTIRIDQKQIRQLDIDSFYTELVKDSLLTIRSDKIASILDERGNHSWNWTDGGPTFYLIEIITPVKKWSLRYPCPKYFYEQYKIEEFKTPLKIITSLMFLLGLSPC